MWLEGELGRGAQQSMEKLLLCENLAVIPTEEETAKVQGKELGPANGSLPPRPLPPTSPPPSQGAVPSLVTGLIFPLVSFRHLSMLLCCDCGAS